MHLRSQEVLLQLNLLLLLPLQRLLLPRLQLHMQLSRILLLRRRLHMLQEGCREGAEARARESCAAPILWRGHGKSDWSRDGERGREPERGGRGGWKRGQGGGGGEGERDRREGEREEERAIEGGREREAETNMEKATESQTSSKFVHP